MKMMSKEQRTLSLSTPRALVSPPWLPRTQTAYELFSHLPSSQPERQPRLAWTYSRRVPTDQRVYSTVPQQPTREKRLVRLFICLSVWSIDHPTTIALPEIAVRDYLFGEPHLFFKWPYLSLKKWDTWGQWGRECFFLFSSFFFCVHRCRTCCHQGAIFVTEDTGHLSFSAFSWWSLYYVKASVP